MIIGLGPIRTVQSVNSNSTLKTNDPTPVAVIATELASSVARNNSEAQ